MKKDKFRVFFDYEIGFYTPDFWDMKKVFKTYNMGDTMPHQGTISKASNNEFLFLRLYDETGVHSTFFKVNDIYSHLSFFSKGTVGKTIIGGNL